MNFSFARRFRLGRLRRGELGSGGGSSLELGVFNQLWLVVQFNGPRRLIVLERWTIVAISTEPRTFVDDQFRIRRFTEYLPFRLIEYREGVARFHFLLFFLFCNSSS